MIQINPADSYLPQFKTPLDHIPVPTRYIKYKEDDCFFMRAKGNGMKPLISNRELILFRKESDFEKLKHDDIILIEIKGELWVKIYKETYEGKLLVSFNKEEYRPLWITKDIKLLGIRIVMTD